MTKINLPEAFVARVEKDEFLGPDFCVCLDTDSPISVRLNPKKTKAILPYNKAVDWCENGFYLETRPSYISDPLFHAGAYYPQEAGSMTLDTVLRNLNLSENSVILDLCASPGGKSTLIKSFLGNKGLLVSNEVINSRAKTLRENLVKWGGNNTIVTNNDSQDFQKLPSFFDVVVVDAPCSGEGMFRKDPNSRTEWKEDSPEFCAARQKRILANAWQTLKTGGYLIYSTCTFNNLENEENVKWLQQEFDGKIIDVHLPKEIIAGREEIGNYCLPNRVETEGFYLAVLQKPELETPEKLKQKSNTSKNFYLAKNDWNVEDFVKGNDKNLLFEWIDNSGKTHLLSIPSEYESEIMTLQQSLRILKMGTRIGEILKNKIIPSEELALDAELLEFQNLIELDKNLAQKYLRGETFPLEGEIGYYLVCYLNEPLGWIKHLGNRFNNMYPKEWRIRKTF